jgi:hypothetical protein
VASAGCVIVVAAFKSPAVVARLDDVATVSQAVEQCGGHLGVAEHAGPFTEGEIGGDDNGPTDKRWGRNSRQRFVSIVSVAMRTRFVPRTGATGANPICPS